MRKPEFPAAVCLFLGIGLVSLSMGWAADLTEKSSSDMPSELSDLFGLSKACSTACARIQPSAKEKRWQQIPWMSSLWEARKRAVKEGKPIFVWSMDGHPLGHG